MIFSFGVSAYDLSLFLFLFLVFFLSFFLQRPGEESYRFAPRGTGSPSLWALQNNSQPFTATRTVVDNNNPTLHKPIIDFSLSTLLDK